MICICSHIMMLKFCLVTVTIIALVFLAVQTPTHAVSGTCASINYADKCCPPDESCVAADGDCECNAGCHNLGNCCGDVHCPRSK